MPELPEVETVRRGLLPVMEGRRLARVIQRRPDLRWPLPERFAERLTGRRVLRLGRRSKYLLAELDGDETLILHLGMSGRLLVGGRLLGEHVHDVGAEREAEVEAKHDHVVFEIEGGARVTYNDARRFGAMDLQPTDRLHEHRLLASLGPEPLGNGFSGAWLRERLDGRTTSIKAALMDQRNVAGLGNIYVCEALWRARISPRRAAGSISAARLDALAGAVRETLEAAIAAGGSSLRDYRRADGELGYFQHAFAVYGRAEQPCLREACRGAVKRIAQTGRSTFYCPACQR